MLPEVPSSVKPGFYAGNRLAVLISAAVLAIGTVLGAGIIQVSDHARSNAIKDQIAKEQAQTRSDARLADQALTQIYQNIRTLSLLPDVRAMDRHATNLGPSARQTIQQVYNNLWSNVRVSEIYFVPASFDPLKVDLKTGEGEAPALMYDEMITGNAADATQADNAAAVTEQPELEDQEYALLVRQIARLKDAYPDMSAIRGLNVPIVTGPSVVTCDNSDYNQSLKDFDRQGLVFSVPYFLPSGEFGGVVSAIVRLKVMSEFLPPVHGALVQAAHKVTIPSVNPGQAKASATMVSVGKPDDGLIYSETVSLALPDLDGAWQLWRGLPDETIMQAPEIVSIDTQMQESLAVLAIVIAGALAATWFVQRRYILPANHITSALIRIADGEVDTDVPLAERKDMLGNISRAVTIFKSKAEALRLAESERLDRIEREQAMRAEQEAETARRASQIMVVIEQLGAGLKRLAECNIRMTIDEPFVETFEQIRHDFNASLGAFQTTLIQVLEATRQVKDGSNDMHEAAEDMAKRTEQQAAALEQTSAAMEQITANVSLSRQGADNTREIARLARESTRSSGEIVSEAVAAMGRIEKASNEIGQIIGVIDEIAFQTNLLALNAGVEAARAGDAGKGFAVVAQEVRELAQRSASAAKEIKELVRNSSTEVSSGVKLVGQTGQALAKIDNHVIEIDQNIQMIATGIAEQSTGMTEIASSLNSLDQMTQKNAAMGQQTSALATELSAEATRLAELVANFKLNRRTMIREPGHRDPPSMLDRVRANRDRAA